MRSKPIFDPNGRAAANGRLMAWDGWPHSPGAPSPHRAGGRTAPLGRSSSPRRVSIRGSASAARHSAQRWASGVRCGADASQETLPRRAALTNIPFEPDLDLRSGHEIAYLSSGDQLGRVIEDDALDVIADVSPVKDVGNVGQRHHNEAASMS